MSSSKIVMLSFAVIFSTAALQAFDLAGGKESAEIVIPANAEPSTVLAARELSAYVKKVSGQELAVATEKSGAQNQILIGTLDTLKGIPSVIQKKLASAQKTDAYFILAKGNRLYIVGKKSVGELFGTYQFIEDKLGVRWLKAAEENDDGEYVPKQSKILLSDYEMFREPYFKYRRIDQCAAYWNVTPRKGKTWAVRNGYQIPRTYNHRMPATPEMKAFYDAITPDMVNSQGGHVTFSQAVPAEKYFSTNPEYFTLLNGKRVLFDGGQKGIYQYCISNPKVQELVADYVCNLFKQFGTEKIAFLFGMTDTSVGWCECPECRKLDQSSDYNYLNISTRFHTAVESIARKIYKQYPDARLMVWAYNTYREIPKSGKHDPRMAVQYCIHGRCYGHALDTPECPRNRKLFEQLKEWLKLSPTVFTYEYFISTEPTYTPHELTQAHDLKLFKKIGMSGYKEEGYFADSRFVNLKPNDHRTDVNPSNWQWLYVTGKLLWDPDLDVNALLAEAEQKYYGAAYPAMKKYHDLRRKLWENTPVCMGYPTGDQRRPMLLNTPGSKEELLRLLSEAEKLAANDPKILVRIARDRYFLNRYWVIPNEEAKAKFGNAFAAPKVNGKIIIDGNGSDPAWVGAYYTDAFKETFTEAHAPIPAELKTTVGILSDDKNLYFLVTALEPGPEKMKMEAKPDGAVWGDDSFEIFIHPPTAANSYYQVVVNPKGTVYDAVCPGSDATCNLGVEVKTRILKDRYILEIKVPVSKIGNFERGELWRIHFTRNRKVGDAAGSFSIDGVENHNTTGYRALEIGSPYIKNGSFDDVKDGKVIGWTLENASPVKSGSGHALKIEKGRCYQLLTDPALWQSPTERKVTVTFKASGSGKLEVLYYCYSDTTDSKAKYGYTRKFLGSRSAALLTLEKDPKIYTLSFTIPPDEWSGLAFHAVDAVIDDISVRKEK